MHQFVQLFAIIGLMILTIHQISTMAEPMRGDNMEPANIPFVASIAEKENSQAGGSRRHHATGALIAEDLVLTAAHCVENYEYHTSDLMFGAASVEYANTRYDVHSWITFKQWATNKDPNYTADEPDDVALIKLKSRVTGTIPANITTLQIGNFYGKNATLVGWVTGENGKAKFMKKAMVQVLSPTDYEERFQLQTNSVDEIPRGYVFTSADPLALITSGDSGGPLLDENNNIIAVSIAVCTGNTECYEDFIDEKQFNVHTYFLDKYKQFIDEMKANWLQV